MWQETEEVPGGEVPGLPLDLLRSLIRSPGPEPMEGQASPSVLSRAATMATEKPLSISNLQHLWQRLEEAPARAERGLWLALEARYLEGEHPPQVFPPGGSLAPPSDPTKTH